MFAIVVGNLGRRLHGDYRRQYDDPRDPPTDRSHDRCRSAIKSRSRYPSGRDKISRDLSPPAKPTTD